MHDDTKHIPGEGVREFYRKQGVSVANYNFRQQLLDLLCREFRKDNTCSHEGKCQEVRDLIDQLNLPPETKLIRSEADCDALNSWREAGKRIGRKSGTVEERYRIIELLISLDAIRRDMLGDLVAFNTHGTKVIYLTGLENK